MIKASERVFKTNAFREFSNFGAFDWTRSGQSGVLGASLNSDSAKTIFRIIAGEVAIRNVSITRLREV